MGTATALAIFTGSLARLGEDKVFETVLQGGHGLEALLAVVLEASPAPLVALVGWMAVGTAIAWSRQREAPQSSLLS